MRRNLRERQSLIAALSMFSLSAINPANAADSMCRFSVSELVSHVPGASIGKEFGQAIEIRGSSDLPHANYQCKSEFIQPNVQFFWDGSQMPTARAADFIAAIGAEFAKKNEKRIRLLLKKCITPTIPRHADHDNMFDDDGLHIECSTEANNVMTRRPDGNFIIGFPFDADK